MISSPSQTGLVTPIRHEDIEEISHLAREIWYLHYPGIITVAQIDYMLEQRYGPEHIAAQLSQESACWYKLETDAGITGFACTAPGSSESSEKLDKLYVHPRVQGRGFGYALMRYVEKCARARNKRTLYLQVNKENTASIDFYRRIGFAETESVVVNIGGGHVMDDYIMSKQLAVSAV